MIDSGETDTHWVIVMPGADKSLRKHLIEVVEPLDVSDAVAILSDIAVALADLDGKVVHRDLKPENVLLLDGAWCLADFGISRYTEAATAPDTRKFALTPAYAAPERWRHERATIATEVYSLGVIAHELLSLAPIRGSGSYQFPEQHLHSLTSRARPPHPGGRPRPGAGLLRELARPAPAAGASVRLPKRR